jgi:predicted secreted hydrolase
MLIVGCARSADVVLAPPAVEPTLVPYRPIQLPRDEAPHDMLTEWWYYTGHLASADGRRFGFEFVIFQTVRGDYPTAYLGQLAVTDVERGTFQYANRVAQGSQIGRQDALDLAVQDWRMSSTNGSSQLSAAIPGYSLSLSLQPKKPIVLHDDDGLVSFGPAGDSYYYSFTRLEVAGTLDDHGSPLAVTGQAWFDHQWGNFLVLGGGWDWLSAQLDDGAELMLNYLRDDQNQLVGVWGTYVDPGGAFRSLTAQDFSITPIRQWTSPHSGGSYPMGWDVSLREPAYRLRITPRLADQELVSQGAGPTYWEGASGIEGTRDGQPVSGQGYVELTGYAGS